MIYVDASFTSCISSLLGSASSFMKVDSASSVFFAKNAGYIVYFFHLPLLFILILDHAEKSLRIASP